MQFYIEATVMEGTPYADSCLIDKFGEGGSTFLKKSNAFDSEGEALGALAEFKRCLKHPEDWSFYLFHFEHGKAITRRLF